jgi:cell division protein FtsB
MRDIGTRLSRHRLSRYAPPADPLQRKLRWGWVALSLWLVWIGLLSDHSLWRIWRLGQENARAEQQLERTRAEAERLDRELNNPATQRELAERTGREKMGMARPGELVYRIRENAKVDTLGR